MLGSRSSDIALDTRPHGEELYSVSVLGRTLWGWQRRSAQGEVLARSEHLFADYVACLCDSRRRS
jgi:hypothetical protein